MCPKDALYFGFTKPAFLKKFGDSPVKARSHTEGAIAPAPKRYDFSWPEEIAMAVVFVIGFYAFRGLYEGMPFLLSIGLSSVCAFVLVQILQNRTFLHFSYFEFSAVDIF